jgi:transcriptional regulator with XRE-family HTH domain
MAATDSNPVARRWELAAQLRALREDAGKTIEDAAGELMCSVAKISRMETAGRGIQPRDVRDLCRFYGTSDQLQEQLIQAAIDAQQPGWWHAFSSISEQYATFVGLEDAATRIRSAEALRLPGLLQTPEFAFAVAKGLQFPPPSNQWIKEQVALRMKRRARLENNELSLHFVIDEAVLRRPIGGAEVTIAQVRRLIDDASRPKVSLQVIPFSFGAHPGMEGSFQHLSFSNSTLTDVVYVEGLLGTYVLDKAKDVDRYFKVFEYLSKKCALSPDHTIEWLGALLDEFVRNDGAVR